MLKAEIKLGTEYALREQRKPGTPFQRVRIIKHIRGNMWRAGGTDPNPDLIHYVEPSQLRAVCFWLFEAVGQPLNTSGGMHVRGRKDGRGTRGVLMGSATIQGRLWEARAQDWATYVEQVCLSLFGAAFDAARVTSGARLLEAECSAGLLAISRQRLPAADVQEGDLEALPFVYASGRFPLRPPP